VNLGIEINYIKRKPVLNISILLILEVIPLILLEGNRIYLYRNYIFRVIIKYIISN